MSLNLKFNHTTLIIRTKLVQGFIQASIAQSETLLQHCICYSIKQGCHNPPPNRNLDPGFRKSCGSNRNSQQSHISSLWQNKVWMVRMEKILTFPSCFFFRVIAPLYLEELHCFTPRDTILLIQDLDWVLGV
jgi:hypothetical protein